MIRSTDLERLRGVRYRKRDVVVSFGGAVNYLLVVAWVTESGAMAAAAGQQCGRCRRLESGPTIDDVHGANTSVVSFLCVLLSRGYDSFGRMVVDGLGVDYGIDFRGK